MSNPKINLYCQTSKNVGSYKRFLYLLLEHKLFINLYVFIIESGTKINNKMGK